MPELTPNPYSPPRAGGAEELEAAPGPQDLALGRLDLTLRFIALQGWCAGLVVLGAVLWAPRDEDLRCVALFHGPLAVACALAHARLMRQPEGQIGLPVLALLGALVPGLIAAGGIWGPLPAAGYALWTLLGDEGTQLRAQLEGRTDLRLLLRRAPRPPLRVHLIMGLAALGSLLVPALLVLRSSSGG